MTTVGILGGGQFIGEPANAERLDGLDRTPEGHVRHLQLVRGLLGNERMCARRIEQEFLGNIVDRNRNQKPPGGGEGLQLHAGDF